MDTAFFTEKKKIVFFCSIFFLSFFIVGFGVVPWISWLGYISSFCGFSLFWWALSIVISKKKRFFISLLWFGCVEGIHLSWLSSTKYQSAYIFLVYFCVLIWLGLQFGFLTLLLPRKKTLSVLQILFLSSCWTLMEWGRMFVFSGFTWNPIGMAYANNLCSIQLASITGVYGLSFWMMLVNLLALRFFFLKEKKSLFLWLFWAIFPYFFGGAYLFFQEKNNAQKESLSIALVQTNLLPEEKEPLSGRLDSFYPPLFQWQRIFSFLKAKNVSHIDLIILPETAVPFGAHQKVYPLYGVRQILEGVWGKDAKKALPPLTHKDIENGEKNFLVSNAYISQALANLFNADVVIGLDDKEKDNNYNAAFYFSPYSDVSERYVKQILVPMGEYFPFSWCKKIAEKFGITGCFTPGKEGKVFQGKTSFAVSICYEETYPYLMRREKQKGAQLFVNLTNDVWFPSSRLPRQHFEHGKIRAIENGVPLVRSCNTGITAAIDCFGRILKKLHDKKEKRDDIAGAIVVKLSLKNNFTLYSFWGETFLVSCSCFFICLYIFRLCFFIKKNR